MFFEIEVGLTKHFPSLTPFAIRHERAAEVFLLVRRLNNYTRRQIKEMGQEQTSRKKKTNRRPAGDSWF